MITRVEGLGPPPKIREALRPRPLGPAWARGALLVLEAFAALPALYKAEVFAAATAAGPFSPVGTFRLNDDG